MLIPIIMSTHARESTNNWCVDTHTVYIMVTVYCMYGKMVSLGQAYKARLETTDIHCRHIHTYHLAMAGAYWEMKTNSRIGCFEIHTSLRLFANATVIKWAQRWQLSREGSDGGVFCTRSSLVLWLWDDLLMIDFLCRWILHTSQRMYTRQTHRKTQLVPRKGHTILDHNKKEKESNQNHAMIRKWVLFATTFPIAICRQAVYGKTVQDTW